MPLQDYLDFELNIEALPDSRIRVTVVNSPVGSVALEATNPFAPEDIARIISLLDGSLRLARAEAARAARAFGEKLFNAIFTGQVYAAYLASRNEAGARGLRIKLGLDNAGEMEDWPWELLRDPANDYLVLSRQTPLVRFPRLLTVRPVIAISLPLRVLVLISSPTDQEALDVEGEWRDLLEATADLRARGLLEIERVDNAQLTTLQRKLRAGVSYQVFHYIGHAAFDDRTQTGMLAFEDPRTRETMPVSGESLARELSEENSIRLVVLNACQGARKSRTDPYAGIASSIVARGVPAVVAMQFPISDPASRAFSQEFYRALSEGYPIEAATAEARRAISNTLNNLEWATPVLYFRAPSGILFPRRRSYKSRRSVGGLRDRLLQPRILLSLSGILLALFLILVLPGLTGGPDVTTTPGAGTPPLIATLTPTPPTARRDIDLSVVSLRFLPPDPAPGQSVTIAIRIQNTGTSDSGPFGWVWFATNPQEDPVPALQGDVVNLGPGLSTTIITSYRFPWWGTYTTTGWVNFDSRVPETNIFNNFIARSVTTADGPFVNDLTRLPDGTLLEPGMLTGQEFAVWNTSMAAEPRPGCTAPALYLTITDDVSQIGTGLRDQTNTCADLPIAFTLRSVPGGPALTAVRVAFFAAAPGEYTLELLRPDGVVVNTTRLTVSAGGVEEMRVGALDVPFTNVRVVFRGPDGAPTLIRRLILERADG